MSTLAIALIGSTTAFATPSVSGSWRVDSEETGYQQAEFPTRTPEVSWTKQYLGKEVGAPVIAGDYGYYTVYDPNHTYVDETFTLYSVNLVTGAIQWSRDFPGSVEGSSVATDGTQLYLVAPTRTYALNLADGTTIWEHLFWYVSTATSFPSVDADALTFTYDQVQRILDPATGLLLSNVSPGVNPTKYNSYLLPAVQDRLSIHASTFDNTLVAQEKEGQTVWVNSLPWPEDTWMAAPPTIYGSTAYVRTRDGKLRGFDSHSGLVTSVTDLPGGVLTYPIITYQSIAAASDTLLVPSQDRITALVATEDPLVVPETKIGNPTRSQWGEGSHIYFGSDVLGATFECQWDDGEFASCASPLLDDDIPSGTHTLYVRASKEGTTDDTPDSVQSIVDRTAPETIVDFAPAAVTENTSASVTFFNEGGDGRYQCRYQDSPWAVCSSPWSRSGLINGVYELQIRAFDADGNPDPTPAVVSWTVVKPVPDTTILNPPSNPYTTYDGRHYFEYSATPTASYFECRWAKTNKAGTLQTYDWTTCEKTAIGIESNYVGNGPGWIEIRGVDAQGNVEQTPARAEWVVAKLPYVSGGELGTPIDGVWDIGETSNPGAISLGTNEGTDSVEWECRYDNGDWEECPDDHYVAGLVPNNEADGEHTFSIRGLDPVLGYGETRTLRWWRYIEPTASISTTAEEMISGSTMVFFSATDDKGIDHFECLWSFTALNESPVTKSDNDCTSPTFHLITSFQAGSGWFEVQAFDTDGHYSNTAYIVWTVPSNDGGAEEIEDLCSNLAGTQIVAPHGMIESGTGKCVGDSSGTAQYGTSYGDTLFGQSVNDRMYGLGGQDILYGGNGTDVLIGGANADTIYGQAGGDRLYGDTGNDRLLGASGRDRIEGGYGNDVIIGGTGADVMNGGPGNDTINARDGASGDLILCGSGKDVAYVSQGDSTSGCEVVFRR